MSHPSSQALCTGHLLSFKDNSNFALCLPNLSSTSWNTMSTVWWWLWPNFNWAIHDVQRGWMLPHFVFLIWSKKISLTTNVALGNIVRRRSPRYLWMLSSGHGFQEIVWEWQWILNLVFSAVMKLWGSFGGSSYIFKHQQTLYTKRLGEIVAITIKHIIIKYFSFPNFTVFKVKIL